GSSRAIPGADALLFCPSSPPEIESLEFVSSLKPRYGGFFCFLGLTPHCHLNVFSLLSFYTSHSLIFTMRYSAISY
ncbi:hypothetical protein, partial [Yersinia thracica]|uniref:hypothetical protein n=1 Tax=Yersinia thracica TaxID=2890319 RepID=UPI001C2EB226